MVNSVVTNSDQASTVGSYARKQLFCKDRFVAWSHRKRFDLGRELVLPYKGKKLLDYGCGDGTFLSLVQDLFPDAVGADVDPQQTADCQVRFARLPCLSFVLTDTLTDPSHAGKYDVVVCMEVLEHCIYEQLQIAIQHLRRLVKPEGTLIISVPIEIGLSLIGKQLIRTVAGWRGLGDYKYRETYRFREFWKMVFAGEQTAIERPVYKADFTADRPNSYHGHKGFNWLALRRQLKERFSINQIHYSPLNWTRGHFSSQAWLVCNPR